MSGYNDACRCGYCGSMNDPLQLCDCPDALADFIRTRGMPQRETVIHTLRTAGAKIRELQRKHDNFIVAKNKDTDYFSFRLNKDSE